MAAPNQSPSKCEMRSVRRFLNAKSERPIYGNVMNRQNVMKLCREFSEGSSTTMVRCKKKS